MLKNHIKIAWRNILKNALYSGIMLFGLVVGLSMVLLTGAYIWKELQVNGNLKDADRQYILNSEWKDPNMGPAFTTLDPLAERLKENYPQFVENYYRWDGITATISNNEKQFRENILVGDTTFLENFGFELLYGREQDIFKKPTDVLITEDVALKYFRQKNALGKTLKITNYSGQNRAFSVSGVLKKLPQNSVTELLRGDQNSIFLSSSTLKYFDRVPFDDWSHNIIASYIKLKAGVKPEQLQLPIKQLLASNASDEIQNNLVVKPVALSQHYLESDSNLVRRMLYTLGGIALFILFMALINFVNITGSKTAKRMREVGVRRVLGSSKKELILQFIIETVIYLLIAQLMAFAIYPLLQDSFENLIGSSIPVLWEFPISFVVILLAFNLILGGICGLLPAFILSSLKVTEALKDKLQPGTSGIFTRKVLVSFQFAITFILAIAAFVITKQTSYFFEQDLGYDKDAVITATVPRDWTAAGVQHMETIRQQFSNLPQVQEATLSYEIPDGKNGNQLSVYKTGSNPDRAVTLKTLVTDHNFLNTYKIKLLAGRFLSANLENTLQVAMNRSAVKALGFGNAEDAVGTTIKIQDKTSQNYQIVGVVDDFHFGTKQQKIAPQLYFNLGEIPTYRYLSFKLKPEDLSANINAVQEKWGDLLPQSPFNYTFIDQTLKRLYAKELQLKQAAYIASAIAFIMVLLGIFGLVSQNIHTRIKELGIRKVLGASGRSISILFFKEFIIPISAAIFVAAPVGYYLMDNWLANYAYHINIPLVIFIWTTVAIVILIYVLVTVQTLIAADKNPVKSLKTE